MATEEVKFSLTDYQGKKLALAHRHDREVTLTLNNSSKSPNGIPIPLTLSQINKLSDGKNHRITIDKTNIKRGGFLPALLAAIPWITGLLGIGAAGTTVAKNVYDMAKGSGMQLGPPPPPPTGNGMYLGPPPIYGRGHKKVENIGVSSFSIINK